MDWDSEGADSLYGASGYRGNADIAGIGQPYHQVGKSHPDLDRTGQCGAAHHMY
jgi:hypothetical protein